MTSTFVPQNYEDIVEFMQQVHIELLKTLKKNNYEIQDYPIFDKPGDPNGSAIAKAYPTQGILKYHGMSDWDWRIAYFPSISVNNNAAYSITQVQFDPNLHSDVVIIGEQVVTGRELNRVTRTLDVIRKYARVHSCAKVVSKNISRGSKTGKGLGTSSSASAALAAAAISALYGEEMLDNSRFLSCMSRLLAGSGCRSAAGGISLWLSYPGIPQEESFAVRLDDGNQLESLCLITVPIDTRVRLNTEAAHTDAPNSPFYKCWLNGRYDEIIECLNSIKEGDWRTIGQISELDSIRLHGVSMSGSRENKLFAWEPENIILFRMCNDLRSEGIPVYFSTDTGPTTVFLTHKDFAEIVVAKIRDMNLGFEAILGQIAGPPEIIDITQAEELFS